MEEDTAWTYAGVGALFAFGVAGLARFKGAAGGAGGLLQFAKYTYTGDGKSSHPIATGFRARMYVIVDSATSALHPGCGSNGFIDDTGTIVFFTTADDTSVPGGAGAFTSGGTPVPAGTTLVTGSVFDVGVLQQMIVSGGISAHVNVNALNDSYTLMIWG